MKQVIIVFFFLFSGGIAAQDTLHLNGHYIGQNLYMQNPFSDSGFFCTQKVFVNGVEVSYEAASAFEINLAQFNFKINDNIALDVVHRANCSPKLLSPAIDAYRKCENSFLFVDAKNDVLAWKCVEKGGKFIYVVEQYRWNKWVKCGEISSMNGWDTTSYTYSVKQYVHSGENRFRVKAMDQSRVAAISTTVQISRPEIESFVFKNAGVITFANETLYEVYDSEGHLLERGFATEIRTGKFKRGDYYLNYDNKTMEFHAN